MVRDLCATYTGGPRGHAVARGQKPPGEKRAISMKSVFALVPAAIVAGTLMNLPAEACGKNGGCNAKNVAVNAGETKAKGGRTKASHSHGTKAAHVRGAKSAPRQKSKVAHSEPKRADRSEPKPMKEQK